MINLADLAKGFFFYADAQGDYLDELITAPKSNIKITIFRQPESVRSHHAVGRGCLSGLPVQDDRDVCNDTM